MDRRASIKPGANLPGLNAKTRTQSNIHTYGKVDNIPKGIIVCNAQETLAYDDNYRHGKTGSISLLADYFRCVLLKREMGVWVDLDCFLLQPLEVPSHGYLLGHEINTINSAVLHLPSDSQVLNDILNSCELPDKSPYWLDYRRRFLKRAAYAFSGKPWHLGEMGWGIIGPVALTRLIPKYNLLDKVQPMKAFYPLDRHGSSKLFEAEPYDQILNDPDIKSIHIYDKRKKHENPIPDSFVHWATQELQCYIKNEVSSL